MNVVPQQNEGSKERFDLSNVKADTIIISIVENRAREVCISKMNSKNTSVLEVLLIVDTHSYTEALALIEDIQPHEILLHDGLKSSVVIVKEKRNPRCTFAWTYRAHRHLHHRLRL